MSLVPIGLIKQKGLVRDPCLRKQGGFQGLWLASYSDSQARKDGFMEFVALTDFMVTVINEYFT